MSVQKSMPLTKEEVMQLVQLVEANPVIFSKATNATNNQLKDAAWITITDQFNALIASIPRKPEQLRLKWENLKKAARKRSTKIRMNNIKTGGGKPEYIPPDDALDKIAAILGATCDGYTVKFGGDAVVEVEEGISTAVEEFVVVEDHLGSDPTMPIPPKEVPLASTSSQQTPKSKFLFSSVGSKGKFKRQAITEEVKESIRDRNRAIADYYNSKRKQEEEYNVLKKRKLELEILEMEKNLSNS